MKYAEDAEQDKMHACAHSLTCTSTNTRRHTPKPMLNNYILDGHACTAQRQLRTCISAHPNMNRNCSSGVREQLAKTRPRSSKGGESKRYVTSGIHPHRNGMPLWIAVECLPEVLHRNKREAIQACIISALWTTRKESKAAI